MLEIALHHLHVCVFELLFVLVCVLLFAGVNICKSASNPAVVKCCCAHANEHSEGGGRSFAYFNGADKARFINRINFSSIESIKWRLKINGQATSSLSIYKLNKSIPVIRRF